MSTDEAHEYCSRQVEQVQVAAAAVGTWIVKVKGTAVCPPPPPLLRMTVCQDDVHRPTLGGCAPGHIGALAT